MTVSLRPAIKADAGAIAAAHHACWVAAYRGYLPDAVVDGRNAPEFRELWTDRLADSTTGPVWVAETGGGGLAGFASGGPLRAELPVHDGEIVTLYVLTEHQGTGLGRRLFYHIESGMKSADYRSLVAQVLSTTPAGRFYRRLGGHLVESRDEDFRGAPVTLHFFAWPLRRGP